MLTNVRDTLKVGADDIIFLKVSISLQDQNCHKYTDKEFNLYQDEP